MVFRVRDFVSSCSFGVKNIVLISKLDTVNESSEVHLRTLLLVPTAEMI